MEEHDLVQIQRLCDQNAHFRRLFEEHLILEKQLHALDQRPYLTPEEEFERKKMQKLKLAGKDEMQRICRSIRE
ncbi:MAG: YdcH family protein [Syntrophotaleaceae bacterium]